MPFQGSRLFVDTLRRPWPFGFAEASPLGDLGDCGGAAVIPGVAVCESELEPVLVSVSMSSLQRPGLETVSFRVLVRER